MYRNVFSSASLQSAQHFTSAFSHWCLLEAKIEIFCSVICLWYGFVLHVYKKKPVQLVVCFGMNLNILAVQNLSPYSNSLQSRTLQRFLLRASV